MLLLKKPFPQLPCLIFKCQWGLLCFACICYHSSWKENQTNLHLTDALPTASAWQTECTTRLLHELFSVDLHRKITYEENSLYYGELVVAVVQYLCLLPWLYLQENQNRVCHMKSHWLEINPSSAWDFPWSINGRINI